MATRIYQGRITDARFTDSSITENPYQALADTHRLFQDAVNYHLVALAGMADDNDLTSVGGRFRQQVKAIWDEHPKGNPAATTLAQSLCRTLNLKNATFEEAVADIFYGCERPDILPYALQFVLDKTEKGEGVIQQQGRELLPKLCNPAFNGNFDYSGKEKAAAQGLSNLYEICNRDGVTAEEYATFAKEMDLSWAGVKTQTGKYWTQKESLSQLSEAVNGVTKALTEGSDLSWNKLEPRIAAEEIATICKERPSDASRVLAKNAKAVLSLKHAAILFMYYPCQTTARLLSAKLTKPAKHSPKEKDLSLDYTSLSSDPLELTRGDRGYIYKGFTALSNWETSDAEMYEKEWDILAFKEALKAIHGFELKTRERDEERAKLQGRLDFILGKTGKCVQDDDESELPAVLGGDPRFELLQKIVHELKTNEDDREYFISYRARKCSEQIFATWRDLHAEGADEAQLQDAVRAIQASQGTDFGSQPLFECMACAKYHAIWLPIDEADKRLYSADILRDFSNYQRLKEDIDRLSVPVRLTAAEETVSPRALTYSDLTHLGKKIEGCQFKKGKNGEMTLAAVIRNSNGHWVGTPVHVTYSAPRFIRDGLGCDAAYWPDKSKKASSDLSSWLQPLQKALKLRQDLVLERQPAVTLAINGRNSSGVPICHLNFPTSLNMAPLQIELGKAELWKGQFLGVQEEKLHLHWPNTCKSNNKAWWLNAELAQAGFSVLGVDLGVRYAAAWSLIHADTTEQRTGRQGQKISGRLLGTAEGKNWYGYVTKQGLIRLPGEGNQKDVQGIRRATEKEKQELSNIIYCVKNTTETISEDISIMSLNNKVCRLFRGLLSRYRTYLQFCYRLTDASQAEQTKNAMKAYFSYNEVTKNFIPGIVKALDGDSLDNIFELILAETQRLRAILPGLAERITNLLLPRKRGTWKWIPGQKRGYIGSGFMDIVSDHSEQKERKTTRVYATGGLSMARLSQLEDWRKQLQSLNRLLCTTPGTQPLNGRETRFAKVIDPCPRLLEKIDNVREQRVNQIAHNIVAQALGLRLVSPSRPNKNQEGKDIYHGEYEPIPSRRPVDFVVMENLSRYLMREERSRDENSTLMRWAHRQIVAKIKQLLEEVFGIPVLFTHAAYTSKFDSLSSAAGFRADSFTLSDIEKGSVTDAIAPPLLATYKDIFGKLQNEKIPNGFSLYMPSIHNSGEYFISEDALGIHVRNADMNAATNIAWRGIASPEALHLLHRVRMTKTKKGALAPRRDNAREKAISAALFTEEICPDDAQERFTAFYVPYKTSTSVGSLMGQPLEYGKALWGKMKASKWNICHQLNIRLLRKAGFDAFLLERALQNSSDDDIPL